MSFIDTVLVIAVVVIGLRGFYNGLVNELSGVLGIVLGVFFGSRFASSMGEWFSQNVYNFNSYSITSLIGFIIILAVIWGVFLIASMIVSKIIKFSNLVIIDKVFGFVFSSCKIFLIFGFILYSVSKPNFMKGFSDYMDENSKVYGVMKVISSSVIKLPSVQEAVKNTQDKITPAVDATKEKLQEVFENNVTKETQDSKANEILKDTLKDVFEQENLNEKPSFELNQEN